MKKALKITALFLILLLALCGCGGQKSAESKIHGTWFTQANGVGLTVAFGEDNVMTTACSVVDKAEADAAGVNTEIVNGKNITCYYKVEETPDLSGLTSAEQEFLEGKMAIVSYLTEEDMKNSLPGEIIFFTLSEDKLITTQRTGTVDSQTGVPDYSQTVFERNK